MALGAPQRSHEAASKAIALLSDLRQGDRLPPILVTELRRALRPDDQPVPDSLESAVEWIGVDDATKGRAVRELLDVASRVPTRSRPATSSFPRLSSVG
jgi:hypothetical protein